MSRAISPSSHQPYGVARVASIWGVARSSFYAARQRKLHPQQPNKRGPKSLSDEYLLGEIRQLLAAPVFVGEGTQTRAFQYNVNGQVIQATNPENGTVTYTYDDAKGLLTQKLDAKGNKVTYVYDSLKRPTEIHRWVGTVEQAGQLVKLYYDSNPFDGSYGTNLSGRLAVAEFWAKRKADGGGSGGRRRER